MSERALEVAIRADAEAKAAHDRLNRMNGSIDGLRSEVAKANATGTEILRRLDRDAGMEQGVKQVQTFFQDRFRFVAMLVATILGSSVVASLFVLFVKGP